MLSRIKDAEATVYAIESAVGIFEALATGDVLSAIVQLGWTLFWTNNAIDTE